MFGTKILEEKKSKFNGQIRVVRSLGFGTYVQAEGLTQSGGIVEPIWRSTLKKINAKKINAKSVLILGLGGGTVAKLVQKFWPEAKITGVDIDPIMIEMGKKYLGIDKKVKIAISDASNFLTHHSSLPSYDLIFVDLYNGDKFPKRFETENFVHLVRLHLSRSGMAVFNRLYYRDKKKEADKFEMKLRNNFLDVEKFKPMANVMFLVKN